MSIIRRPLIFVAAGVSLLASAAACNGGSPTAATTIVAPPARDSTGFIPPTPPMTTP
ncbi:hypothetical protein [Longimicrobium sp.]|uniref:hypothetical protein n=1 Tax=Longimicrobium sp. TaxID=2029185 RepID=UPI002C9AE62E|nr:hypothetical protein [Longimicrobium sp.]HSU14297.1 hypothetical protein [Longimicrobium sp.]